MASWRWLETQPQTSEEAARWARRAVRGALAAGGLTIAGSLAIAFLLEGPASSALVVGGLFVAFGAASALVHRETYHRLKGAGR